MCKMKMEVDSMKKVLRWLSAMVLGLLCTGLITHAQAQNVVSGTVTDQETGDSMPGVNVVLEGEAFIGTVTDMNGEYELQVPGLDEILVFSFIGYESRRIEIDGRTEINVELTPIEILGEEVVVTAFGLERDRRSLTYSTQGVDTERLSQIRTFHPVTSLQGKVSGLTITQGGQGIASWNRVVLRGERSFRGQSEPLYIIDGVPGDLQNISPDDIVNLDVMKGPNAAALYGSEAQNGAIIVTTRQAEKGRVDFSISNTLTFDTAIDHNQYQNTYGQGIRGRYIASSESSWGPEMTGDSVAHWSPVEGLAGTQYPFNPQPDNVSDFFQVGINNATNITASIGMEQTQTNFSYTFTDGAGVVPGNEMIRHNLSTRVTSQLSDRLHLDGRVSYMMQNVDNDLGFSQQVTNPMRNVYTLPRNIRTQDIEMFEYEVEGSYPRQHFWNPPTEAGSNPYWVINRMLNERRTERFSSVASLRYSLTDQVDVMARGSVNTSQSQYRERLHNNTYVLAMNGYYGISQSHSRSYNGDFLVSYSQDVTQEWSVNANFGGTINARRNHGLSANTGLAGAGDLIIPNLFSLGNTQSVNASYSIGSPSELWALYAFGQVSWRNVIYLDVTGRNDWSSTLPAHNRSYFYPSVGLTTILDDLIDLPDVISMAKVRASWARVGSPAPVFHFARSASISAGGRDGFLSFGATLPNEDLKPEETESIELGLDLRLYRGRLGLDITVYQTNTINQLFSVAVPVASGASSAFQNAGNVENRGIELLLSATPIQTRRLMWDLDVNFAKNQSTVVEVHSDQESLQVAGGALVSYRIEAGEPFGQLFGRGFLRDDDGNVIVASNGIPRFTDAAIPLADFNPDFTASLINTLNYRNFSLSFLIDYRHGGTYVSGTNSILHAAGVTKATLNGRDGDAIFGDNFFSHETAVRDDGSPNEIKISAENFWNAVGGRTAPIAEPFVESATNIRLRELSIGYHLPPSMMVYLPFDRLNVSVVGRNLFFLYNESDADPDIMVSASLMGQGHHSFAPPTTRSIGFNIKAHF